VLNATLVNANLYVIFI